MLATLRSTGILQSRIAVRALSASSREVDLTVLQLIACPFTKAPLQYDPTAGKHGEVRSTGGVAMAWPITESGFINMTPAAAR
jgi:hypothetical protein